MPNSVKSKLIKGLAWEGAVKLFIQISSWASTFIVARLLVPEDYGIVAVSGIFIGFLLHLAEFGIASSLINIKELSREVINTYFFISLLFSLFVFSILILFADNIAHYYRMAELEDVIVVSAFVILLNSLRSIPTATLMRELRYKETAIIQLIGQAVNIATVLSLAYTGHGYWSLILSTVASNSIVTLLYMRHLKTISFDFASYHEITPNLKYGVKLTMSRLLWFIRERIPTFLISMSYDKSTIGHYSMAQTLAAMPIDKVSGILNKVTFPAVSRLQDDINEVGNIYLQLNKYLLIILSPTYIILFMFSEEIILLILTDKRLPMLPYFKLLCALSFIQSVSSIIPVIFDGLGHAGVTFKFSLITLTSTTILMSLGLEYSIEQALINLLIATPILVGYMLYSLNKILRLKYLNILKCHYLIIISFIISICTAYFLQTRIHINSIELLASCALAVFSVFIFFAVLVSYDERKAVRVMINTLSGKRSINNAGK